MGQTRYRVVDDDDAVAFELASLAVEFAITDFKKIKERDQGFLPLTERLENTRLLIRSLEPVPRKFALLPHYCKTFKSKHIEGRVNAVNGLIDICNF